MRKIMYVLCFTVMVGTASHGSDLGGAPSFSDFEDIFPLSFPSSFSSSLGAPPSLSGDFFGEGAPEFLVFAFTASLFSFFFEVSEEQDD